MSFDAIYTDLAERHGGDALGAADRALVRRLAALLSADEFSTADASQIAALTSLLPPPRPPGKAESGWDFDRLSEAQFGLLLELAAVARSPVMNESGELVIPAPPMAEAAPERSPRHWLAVDLAAKLDAIGERPLTDTERTQIAGLITGLMYPCCTPRALWPAEPAPVRSVQEAVNAVPTSEASTGEAAKPVNVVPLRAEPKDAPRQLSPQEAPDCKPLYAPADQSWRNAILGGIGGASRFDNNGGL